MGPNRQAKGKPGRIEYLVRSGVSGGSNGQSAPLRKDKRGIMDHLGESEAESYADIYNVDPKGGRPLDPGRQVKVASSEQVLHLNDVVSRPGRNAEDSTLGSQCHQNGVTNRHKSHV